jgi:hypothetical protein
MFLLCKRVQPSSGTTLGCYQYSEFGLLFRKGKSDRCMKLTTYLYLESRLRVCVVLPPLPHTSEDEAKILLPQFYYKNILLICLMFINNVCIYGPDYR